MGPMREPTKFVPLEDEIAEQQASETGVPPKGWVYTKPPPKKQTAEEKHIEKQRLIDYQRRVVAEETQRMEQQRNKNLQSRISTEESERLHQKTLQELNLKHAK